MHSWNSTTVLRVRIALLIDTCNYYFSFSHFLDCAHEFWSARSREARDSSPRRSLVLYIDCARLINPIARVYSLLIGRFNQRWNLASIIVTHLWKQFIFNQLIKSGKKLFANCREIISLQINFLPDRITYFLFQCWMCILTIFLLYKIILKYQQKFVAI